jgi:hypothetical protein
MEYYSIYNLFMYTVAFHFSMLKAFYPTMSQFCVVMCLYIYLSSTQKMGMLWYIQFLCVNYSISFLYVEGILPNYVTKLDII